MTVTIDPPPKRSNRVLYARESKPIQRWMRVSEELDREVQALARAEQRHLSHQYLRLVVEALEARKARAQTSEQSAF